MPTTATPTAAVVTVPLSARELEVLTLAAQGLTDAQIARRLCITRKTASTHMHNLLRRLGAANRAHAVALGVYLELITLDPLGEHAQPCEEDDKAHLWRLLTDAGPLGTHPTVLADQVGRSRPWAYHHLHDWTAAGWAKPMGHNRWRAVTPARFEHERAG